MISIDPEHIAAPRDFVGVLEELKLKPVLSGGLVVCLVARPRFTKDIEALLMFDTDVIDSLLAVSA